MLNEAENRRRAKREAQRATANRQLASWLNTALSRLQRALEMTENPEERIRLTQRSRVWRDDALATFGHDLTYTRV